MRARIESIDDDGQRAIIVQKVDHRHARVPEAIVAEMRVFVPLGSKDGKRDGEAKKPKARPTVPADAHEICVPAHPATSAGLDFAKLTGDFNPIHWLAAVRARAGFRTVILTASPPSRARSRR